MLFLFTALQPLCRAVSECVAYHRLCESPSDVGCHMGGAIGSTQSTFTPGQIVVFCLSVSLYGCFMSLNSPYWNVQN